VGLVDCLRSWGWLRGRSDAGLGGFVSDRRILWLLNERKLSPKPTTDRRDPLRRSPVVPMTGRTPTWLVRISFLHEWSGHS
jgi:hypothetical protein